MTYNHACTDLHSRASNGQTHAYTKRENSFKN